MLTKLSKPDAWPIREVKVAPPAPRHVTIDEAWAARQDMIRKINKMRDEEYQRLVAEQIRTTGRGPYWYYERSATMRQADANIQAFLASL